MSRTAATEFSFFFAVPIMFAATILDLSRAWADIALSDASFRTKAPPES
jgi:undecaprenyl pyrophosphate phosphatase UppP